jgi:tRNA nucleotidyltransferase/poly(A) polymerase
MNNCLFPPLHIFFNTHLNDTFQSQNTFLFVGGVVRDYVLHLITTNNKIINISPSLHQVPVNDLFYHFLEQQKDIDISTILKPNDIGKILDSEGIHRVRKFATYRIQNNNHQVDITSTRMDSNCDGRHAKMTFGCSYFQDSLRRDFTFNALYMNSQGIIFDFHNGIKHLLENQIHFIGDTHSRLLEDYTRIKRYDNFSKRFGIRNLEIEKTIDYIIKNSTTPIIMR